MDFTVDDDIRDIQAAVRDLCSRFPGEYWQGLEPATYPTEFVAELTRDGWLAALIPEEYDHHADPDARQEGRWRLLDQRAEDLDLAGRALRPDGAARPDHAAR
jgi:alkylation response protein AidB-like acyl-CoA dehydrogenase